MRKLGLMAAGVALATLAACGGGTKASNNVATTNDVYLPADDLGNDLLGNDVLLNDSGASASGNASTNAATTNTTGNRL